MNLDLLVEKARSGSREALEQVVEAVQDDIYRLSIRMLWHPHDAEDATQEILIRVVTNLNAFRGDSAFTTWVYRIASNHLLTTRKRRAEQKPISFEDFAADHAEGLSDAPLAEYTEAEQKLLVQEVKVGCTQAMLLCLDRDHRLTYILGEILELTSVEGAAILEITPEAFRKRFSRSRERIQQFMQGHCGLVNSGAACRCRKRVKQAIKLERVDPNNLLFPNHPASKKMEIAEVEQQIAQLEGLKKSAAVFRSNPEFEAPGQLLESVQSLFDSD